MLPLLILLSCCVSLSWSVPVAPTGRVLMDYSADTHSRFESGIPGDSVKGHYSWSDGHKIYRVDYTADQNGYRPVLTTKLVGADDVNQQKPVAQVPQQVFAPPAPAVVAQKPQAVQFEPSAVPIASFVPVISAPASSPVLVPPPLPANAPIHVTDDAVIIEADYAHHANINEQNKPINNEPNQEPAKTAFDLVLIDYIHQLLQYQNRLIEAREHLQKFQEELTKSYSSSLTRDQIEDLEYEQLAKQFSFMSREDYEYEQLAKQLSFLPQSNNQADQSGNKPAAFRLGADYSRQMYENEQQLQQVQYLLLEAYNYLFA